MSLPSSEISRFVKRIFFLVICVIFILALMACAPVAAGVEVPLLSPTPLVSTNDNTPLDPSVQNNPPSAVPAPEKTTPSDVQNMLNTVEPLITANSLRFDSWSLDSKWIAYWFADNKESSISLGFANILSNEICQHEEIIAQNLESGTIIWQNDNKVVVVPGLEEEAMTGAPCERFFPLENGPSLEGKGEVSPDGHYRAVTTFTSEGQLIHNTVTITDTATNKTILTFFWEASVHAVRGGPSWLTNDLYLIGQTYQQGLLYLSVPDGQTGNVLTDLMGIENYDEETVWWVFSHVETAIDKFHILLQWWGGPTQWPPLLLYHSESALVENLPFYKARPFSIYSSLYGFSPDGLWLLVGNPVEGGNPAEDSGEDYWLRSVDPPGGSFVQLANQAALGGLSNNGQMTAFLHANNSIQIVSFPDGQLLSQWQTPGYEVDRLWWSADSSGLIAWGINLESGQHTLFVIQP